MLKAAMLALVLPLQLGPGLDQPPAVSTPKAWPWHNPSVPAAQLRPAFALWNRCQSGAPAVVGTIMEP